MGEKSMYTCMGNWVPMLYSEEKKSLLGERTIKNKLKTNQPINKNKNKTKWLKLKTVNMVMLIVEGLMDPWRYPCRTCNSISWHHQFGNLKDEIHTVLTQQFHS